MNPPLPRQVVRHGEFSYKFLYENFQEFKFLYDFYVLNVSLIILVFIYWLGRCEEVRLS